ncbi:helix-turn-helix domain-containing protein [Pseudonocardia xinjiangensis]|uniref:helix-turn-helix domain-containing protein n=1 Tax=Pseudonocardia xinjiangensis TaxID=75289 RepID=UPI003D8B6771
MIHAFNERGLAALDPQWAGGRHLLFSDDDIAFIVTTATTRPGALDCPFTRWSIRKLVAHLSRCHERRIVLSCERLRLILREAGVSFQRTRTWKESTDPDKDTKPDRIEEVTSRFLHRCFAFDQFGPLSIRPCHGSTWAPESKPSRLRATYTRTHGLRYFHGCYSLGDDQLWGVTRRRKGGDHTLAALTSIRAARPEGAPIYVIMDFLSAQDTEGSGMGRPQQGRAVLHPDLRLLGQPDRGPVRATAHLRRGGLEPPQPPGPGSAATGLPALAQRQCPPRRCPRRATQRTRPCPQGTPATLGAAPEPPHDQSPRTYVVNALDIMDQ